jgi:hypothetical protein
MSTAKAILYEVDKDGHRKKDVALDLIVQFNPETLRISYANQIAPPRNTNPTASAGTGAGDQSNNASNQYLGGGSTRLSVQVWFDVTGQLPQGQQAETDVRQLTRKVAYFMKPQREPGSDNNAPGFPPRVCLEWGTFLFDGVMDSLEETLELFSSSGTPLRASVSFTLMKQEIQIAPQERPQPGGANLGGAAGTTPLFQAQAGATLQSITASAGVSADWQSVASANGIENPRQLEPGQLINVNLSGQVSGSFG